MTYKPIPTRTEGNRKLAMTSDENSMELLVEILKQLKMINIHMSIISDNTVEKEETDNAWHNSRWKRNGIFSRSRQQ